MTEKVPGNLHVSNDVLADLAGDAALDCYGVVGMASANAADPITSRLGAKRIRKGIVVTPGEDGVQVDIHVVLEYGVNITTVAQNLIDNVTYVLTTYAQVPVDRVDVHVQGVKVRK